MSEHTFGPVQTKFERLVEDRLAQGETRIEHDGEPDNVTIKSAEYRLTATDATLFATRVLFKETVQVLSSEEEGAQEERRHLGIEMYGGVLDDDYVALQLDMNTQDGEFHQTLPYASGFPVVEDVQAIEKIINQVAGWQQEGKLNPVQPED